MPPVITPPPTATETEIAGAMTGHAAFGARTVAALVVGAGLDTPDFRRAAPGSCFGQKAYRPACNAAGMAAS